MSEIGLGSKNDAGTVDIQVPLNWIKRRGWTLNCLGPDLGGAGWGCNYNCTHDALLALIQLGYANLPAARIFEGHMNATKLLYLYGSQLTKEHISSQIKQGAILAVWGADKLSDPVNSSIANKKHRLNGSKRFASGLGFVHFAIISAKESDKTQLFLMQVEDADRMDHSTWDMSGMQSTLSGTYDFKNISIQANDKIGCHDSYFEEPHFQGGIWRYCAAQLGAAAAITDEVFSILRDMGRHQNPVQISRLTAMEIAVETSYLWVVNAALSVEAPKAAPHTAFWALKARLVTADCCQKVIHHAKEALGMAAHESSSRINCLLQDLSLYICQAAPDAKNLAIGKHIVERKSSGLNK